MFCCLCFLSWLFFSKTSFFVQVEGCNETVFLNPLFSKVSKLSVSVFACFAFYQVYLSENTNLIVVSEKCETTIFDKKRPFLKVGLWTKVKVSFGSMLGPKRKVILVRNQTLILLTLGGQNKTKKPSTHRVWLRTTSKKIGPDPSFQNG